MEGDPIPIDELYATDMDVHAKVTAIIRSSSAILSLISSSALIWTIKKSRSSFKTTYNRILLAMAISDVLMSLSLANFNFTAPSDGSYYVWNASGNQVTCTIQGFTLFMGGFSGLFYSCSINLYSLAVVRYRKPDSYIRRKVEPFLLGFPIVISLIANIPLLAKQNFNDGGGGTCNTPIYRPPHCIGYEDGETREGFDIPCGRGYDGAVGFRYFGGVIMLFQVPLTIGISLGMIYRSVSKQENNMASYGANNFTASEQRLDRSNSRAVLHRALAYSIAYFLAWTFFIVGSFFEIANKEIPMPLKYLKSFFGPLQGFFNFGIYIYPKVMKAKSRGGDNMTWFQAFKTAFFWRGTGRAAGGQRRQPPPNRALQTPVVGGLTLPSTNETSTVHLGQDDAGKLDNEIKGDENNKATTADNVDNGYKEFLIILNRPSAFPDSDSRQP